MENMNESKLNKYRKLLRLSPKERAKTLSKSETYSKVWAEYKDPNSEKHEQSEKALNNEVSNQINRAAIANRAAKKVSDVKSKQEAYAEKNKSFKKIEEITRTLKKKNMNTNTNMTHPRNPDYIEKDEDIIATPITQVTDNKNKSVSFHTDKEYGELRKPSEKKVYSIGSDKYFKDTTKKNLNQTTDNYIKRHNLKEDSSLINFSEKIADVLEELKDIEYGFISTKDGSRIDNREFIHSCSGSELQDIYQTNWDPRVTIQNKLGICVDQCLATKYLIKKLHPEIKVTLYALYKGRFGHCVCTLEDVDGKFYYLENAWDKEKGLYEFDSKEELEKHLDYIYHKHHDKDNDDPVEVLQYIPPVEYDRFSLLQEQCFLNQFIKED